MTRRDPRQLLEQPGSIARCDPLFETGQPIVKKHQRNGDIMEFLIPLALIGVWIVLQSWVLPKMGVRS
jgi:hypothetical protein